MYSIVQTVTQEAKDGTRVRLVTEFPGLLLLVGRAARTQMVTISPGKQTFVNLCSFFSAKNYRESLECIAGREENISR